MEAGSPRCSGASRPPCDPGSRRCRERCAHSTRPPGAAPARRTPGGGGPPPTPPGPKPGFPAATPAVLDRVPPRAPRKRRLRHGGYLLCDTGHTRGSWGQELREPVDPAEFAQVSVMCPPQSHTLASLPGLSLHRLHFCTPLPGPSCFLPWRLPSGHPYATPLDPGPCWVLLAAQRCWSCSDLTPPVAVTEQPRPAEVDLTTSSSTSDSMNGFMLQT